MEQIALGYDPVGQAREDLRARVVAIRKEVEEKKGSRSSFYSVPKIAIQFSSPYFLVIRSIYPIPSGLPLRPVYTSRSMISVDGMKDRGTKPGLRDPVKPGRQVDGDVVLGIVIPVIVSPI